VTFALLTEALFEAKDKILIPVGIMPFFMLLFLTGFEILVAFLQAYIFTILTAVYINNATASHDAEHDTHETAHEAAPGPAPVPTS
jgi:F-type H+-transporting ATPase subunit a